RHRTACRLLVHACRGPVPDSGQSDWCRQVFACSPRALMTRRFGGGFANFSERHPLPLVAGERALERPNAGMHTNGSPVSRHFIFQLVARFNSQGLSNFLGNGRLSLTRHRRMKYRHVLTFKFILTSIIPLTSFTGKAYRNGSLS